MGGEGWGGSKRYMDSAWWERRGGKCACIGFDASMPPWTMRRYRKPKSSCRKHACGAGREGHVGCAWVSIATSEVELAAKASRGCQVKDFLVTSVAHDSGWRADWRRGRAARCTGRVFPTIQGYRPVRSPAYYASEVRDATGILHLPNPFPAPPCSVRCL